jgi:hypothetical protein
MRRFSSSHEKKLLIKFGKKDLKDFFFLENKKSGTSDLLDCFPRRKRIKKE